MDDFMMRNAGCLSNETCEFLVNYFNTNEDIAFIGGIGADEKGNRLTT